MSEQKRIQLLTPNGGEIKARVHCAKCLIEWKDVLVIEGEHESRCANCGALSIVRIEIIRGSDGTPNGYLVMPPEFVIDR